MSPSIAAGAGRSFDLAALVFQRCFSFSGFYAFQVGLFLRSPLSAEADSMTSPLGYYIPLPCVAVAHLQSHSSTFVCSVIFFVFRQAEPRTQLCSGELGSACRQLTAGCWWQPRALGRRWWRGAAPLLQSVAAEPGAAPTQVLHSVVV